MYANDGLCDFGVVVLGQLVDKVVTLSRRQEL